VAAAGGGRVVAVGDQVVLNNSAHQALARIWDGAAWTEMKFPYAHDRVLNDVIRTPAGVMVAVGWQDPWVTSIEGVVMRSLDDGRTWSAGSLPGAPVSGYQASNYLQRVWAADSTHLWAVGYRYNPVADVKAGNIAVPRYEGLVARSSDGGATWTQTVLPSGTTSHRYLYGITGTDATHVVVVGYDATTTSTYAESRVVLRTQDGGATWTRVTSGVLPAAGELTGLWGSGPDMFAVGSGQALRSTDGGASWASAGLSGIGSGLAHVWGADARSVYVVGASGGVFRYDGARWTTMTRLTSSALRGVGGASATDVYAVGDEVTVLHGTR